MENFLPMFMLICGVAFLVGRSLAWIVNKMLRRRLLNTALVGTACTLPWSLAPIYVFLTDTNGKLVRMSPESQGYVATLLTVSALVLAIGAWLAIGESKRAKQPIVPAAGV